ncbi:hypothetical protein AAT17_11620 [Nonlabens sp. MIC269]|nr:hypothetical protein AAT17_11620 [Nonlabens sp. MIC269]
MFIHYRFTLLFLFFICLCSCEKDKKDSSGHEIELVVPNQYNSKVIIENKENIENINVYYTYDSLNQELLIGFPKENNLVIKSSRFESKSQKFIKINIEHVQIKDFLLTNEKAVSFESLPNELFIQMILK